MVTKTASREHWLNHAEVKTEALTVVLGDWAVLGCHSPCYPPAHLHVTEEGDVPRRMRQPA